MIILKDGTHYTPSLIDIQCWRREFGNIEVSEQLQIIVQWFFQNEDKRRDREDISAFVERWLSKRNGLDQ